MERFLLAGQEAGAARHRRAGRHRSATIPPEPLCTHRAARTTDVRRRSRGELRRPCGGARRAARGGRRAHADHRPRRVRRAERTRGDRSDSKGWSGPPRPSGWVTRELRVLALARQPAARGSGGRRDVTQRVLGLLIPPPERGLRRRHRRQTRSPPAANRRRPAGRPGFRLRNTPDGRAVVISAAHTIWNGDECGRGRRRGEHQSDPSRCGSQALERLLVLTLAAFRGGPRAC